jgi:polyferredoxin
MKKNFNNQNFEWLFDDITSTMPKIIFVGIILTYAITAALNVYFLPLPLMLSIPASLMLQFGRFAIVFIDFLNPSSKRSKFILRRLQQ